MFVKCASDIKSDFCLYICDVSDETKTLFNVHNFLCPKVFRHHPPTRSVLVTDNKILALFSHIPKQ